MREKKHCTCDHFLENYGGLRIVNSAFLGQLTRDIVRTINASADT